VGFHICVSLDLRAYQLKISHIQVVQEIEDISPILGDGGQLQQVFLNLIANAEWEMSTSHGGGTLLIRVQSKASDIIISFEDDGPGISLENMQKLFQPFFTTKPVGKGTGLGLSICHGIVTEHNGRIWAESQLGKGAAFYIQIPIMQPEEMKKEDVEGKE
jgi:signal transduction histidine kinase